MAIDYSVPILVVDDYRTVVGIVQRLLKQAGFSNVDGATDGEEALARMKERKYGLVLSDWHMAPVNGMELLEKIKADESLKDTPMVLISAEESPENVSAARAAGAAGFVVKPFDASTLKARVEGVLRAA